ncbi:MAG: hypothetical protein QM652_07520 [Legionella sp.]|uniref:cytochrome oxidase putative small subunit CydP n=1 Tax=Legionella sp. TaxID=459 RepID=UPI0039E3F867
MRKPLTRDILLTLLIKLVLLFVLWSICFKNVAKPKQNTQQWLFGTIQQKQ